MDFKCLDGSHKLISDSTWTGKGRKGGRTSVRVKWCSKDYSRSWCMSKISFAQTNWAVIPITLLQQVSSLHLKWFKNNVCNIVRSTLFSFCH